MKFFDSTNIIVKAGTGGNGVIDFLREMYRPKGGPSGGNGGDGGNIILKATHNCESFYDLQNNASIFAENGHNGGTDYKHGKNGKDRITVVPIGTSVYEDGQLIYSFSKNDETYIVAKGGRGGRGNKSFASSYNPVPRLCENGDLGQTKKIKLDLKLFADLGLFGMPNVGKTSILKIFSNSKAKTSNYAFTTLYPNLAQFNEHNEKIIIADTPGIIKGAHEGKGLGLKFLKHIEKCGFLIAVLELSKDITSNTLKTDFQMLKNELASYNDNVAKKIELIILNKSDLEKEENKKHLCGELSKVLKTKVICFSTITLENIDILNSAITSIFEKKKLIVQPVEKFYKLIELEDSEIRSVSIKKTKNNEWEISGKTINYWLNKIPFTSDENQQRFLKIINDFEIEEEIIENGGKKGDVVNIGDLSYTIT